MTALRNCISTLWHNAATKDKGALFKELQEDLCIFASMNQDNPRHMNRSPHECHPCINLMGLKFGHFLDNL